MAKRSEAKGAKRLQRSEAQQAALTARAHKGTSLVSLVLGKAWKKLVSSLFLAIGRLAGIYAADCGRTTKALDRLKQVWNKHVSIMFQGS